MPNPPRIVGKSLDYGEASLYVPDSVPPVLHLTPNGLRVS